MATKGNSTAYRIVGAQALVTIVFASLITFFDLVAGYSVLLGGMTGAVPSAYMAWRFGTREVADAGVAFSHLIRGEVGKFLLTVALFIGCFGLVEPLHVGAYFAGLGMTLICNIVVPVLIVRRDSRPKQAG